MIIYSEYHKAFESCYEYLTSITTTYTSVNTPTFLLDIPIAIKFYYKIPNLIPPLKCQFCQFSTQLNKQKNNSESNFLDERTFLPSAKLSWLQNDTSMNKLLLFKRTKLLMIRKSDDS
jgi:hypothetical protein